LSQPILARDGRERARGDKEIAMTGILKNRLEPPPVSATSVGDRVGISGERLGADPHGTTPKPTPPANHGDYGRRQPHGAGQGHAAPENACVQRDRAGSLHYQTSGQAHRNEPTASSYDTRGGLRPSLAAYNRDLALICERAVTAMESIASALIAIASGRPPQDKTVPKIDQAYGTGEAARLLGLNEQTVRKYCRDRVFGTQTTGGRWVIRQSEVDRFLEGRYRIHGKGKVSLEPTSN
jgi:excisionase family DNA binding protein